MCVCSVSCVCCVFKVGVPTTDALCDSLPEVLMVAAAAFICYWVGETHTHAHTDTHTHTHTHTYTHRGMISDAGSCSGNVDTYVKGPVCDLCCVCSTI